MTTSTHRQGREALFLTTARSALSADMPQACQSALIPKQCQRCGKCQQPDESFAAMGDEARLEMLERGYGG